MNQKEGQETSMLNAEIHSLQLNYANTSNDISIS